MELIVIYFYVVQCIWGTKYNIFFIANVLDVLYLIHYKSLFKLKEFVLGICFRKIN